MKSNTGASSKCSLIKNLKAKVLPDLSIKKQPSASVKPLNHSKKSLWSEICLPSGSIIKCESELPRIRQVNSRVKSETEVNSRVKSETDLNYLVYSH